MPTPARFDVVVGVPLPRVAARFLPASSMPTPPPSLPLSCRLCCCRRGDSSLRLVAASFRLFPKMEPNRATPSCPPLPSAAYLEDVTAPKTRTFDLSLGSMREVLYNCVKQCGHVKLFKAFESWNERCGRALLNKGLEP